MPLHRIAKSSVKPIFSPLPRPTFFTPKSPFFALFPVLGPSSGDFSRARTRFLPCEAHFFSLFPVLGPFSGTSSRDLTLYFRHTSLFAQREGFFISCFPFFILYPTFIFPLISFPPFIPPSLFTTPPLSLSFLPTFPSTSPINARTRAPSRNTRVRVRPHLLARQEVFFYCLHRFTHPSQSTVHQRVRCEGKREKAFTEHTTISKSLSYHKAPDFIRLKLHLITAVNPTIPTVNLKTKSLHPLRAVPQPFAAYR